MNPTIEKLSAKEMTEAANDKRAKQPIKLFELRKCVQTGDIYGEDVFVCPSCMYASFEENAKRVQVDTYYCEDCYQTFFFDKKKGFWAMA